MKHDNNIPYKIYLEEQEMPKQWYNVRADMQRCIRVMRIKNEEHIVKRM